MSAAVINRNGTDSAAEETRRNIENKPEAETGKNVAAAPQTSTVATIERTIKHPLNSRWSLWYFVNDKNVKWELSQVLVASYDTVEDFWALFNHIECASALKLGCDYSLFKHGIKPMWEDPANINGGRWSVTVPKHQRATELDNLWMEMMMMMVGENEEECVNNEICGGVVGIRPRGDRLALWTASSKKPEVAMKVGRSLKDALSVPSNHMIEFNLHSDTSSKRSSSVRALYTV